MENSMVFVDLRPRNWWILPVGAASGVVLSFLVLLQQTTAASQPPAAPVLAPAVIAAPAKVAPAPEPPRAAHVVLVRGRQRLEVDLPFDGRVTDEVADDLARLMRCPESGRTRRIAVGTLALLADLAARFPGHEIEVVSAVRAEPERSRAGVKHSKHWDGHAIDLRVRGAKLTAVRDTMWKSHHGIGLGWYPTLGFLHLDYRPEQHDTAWTAPREGAPYVYHPGWSARR